jgi:hypothetical protein
LFLGCEMDPNKRYTVSRHRIFFYHAGPTNGPHVTILFSFPIFLGHLFPLIPPHTASCPAHPSLPPARWPRSGADVPRLHALEQVPASVLAAALLPGGSAPVPVEPPSVFIAPRWPPLHVSSTLFNPRTCLPKISILSDIRRN